ncbi:hypothetical protein HPFOLIGI_03124 [Mannheimia haemolytica]
MRSSAASCARILFFSTACWRTNFIDTSARSRIIESTSLPTYPTSVNLVASTLIKGALASFAKRRAISVLPTPVGPIIKIFLGVTSWRRSSGNCILLQRLRKAIATARFASFCPIMCASNSETISRGVIDIMLFLKLITLSPCGRGTDFSLFRRKIRERVTSGLFS